MERRDFIRKAGSGAALGAAVLATGLSGCSDSNVSPATPQSNPDAGGMKGPHLNAWQAPLLLDFTIIPARVTAEAWTNPSYKTSLLTNSTETLRQATHLWPRDRDFAVSEDSTTYRWFALPYRKSITGTWTKQQAQSALAEEMGGDDQTFEVYLPPAAIAEAWFNPIFKEHLLSDPTTALQGLGLTVPSYQLRVVESTETLTQLALLLNPLQQELLDVNELVKRLQDTYGVNTTKCCASGTCDTSFPFT